MLKYNGTCGRTRRGSCTDGERRRCQGSSGCGEVVWVRRASSLFLHLFLFLHRFHLFHLFLHLHCFFIGFFICFGFFTVSSLLFLHLHCVTSCDPILLSCSRYQQKLIAYLFSVRLRCCVQQHAKHTPEWCNGRKQRGNNGGCKSWNEDGCGGWRRRRGKGTRPRPDGGGRSLLGNSNGWQLWHRFRPKPWCCCRCVVLRVGTACCIACGVTGSIDQI